MTDSLLPFYNRELDALRRLAKDFAEAHPKIAGRLRLGTDTVDDPHVERLLEGVAFLTARAQQRLDDEFPEFSDAMLGVLYPHYLAPVPSAAIVQFTGKPNLRVPITVPRGRMLDTEPVGGEAVRFRTAYASTLWPIEIESVRLSGLPLMAPWGLSRSWGLRRERYDQLGRGRLGERGWGWCCSWSRRELTLGDAAST